MKLFEFEKLVKSKIGVKVHLSEKNGAIVLEGRTKKWEQVVKAGKLATKLGYRGVVNLLECEEVGKETIIKPNFRDNELEGVKVDVLIIGAGVVGCSIARELSRYKLNILVVDKEPDVAFHQSSRNAGMIHPPIAPKPGTKKAFYNSLGIRMIPQLAKELDFPYVQNGLIILFKNPLYLMLVGFLNNRARKNGIDVFKILSKSSVKKLEPNLIDQFSWGYFLPQAGIVDPFKMTLALAENAVQNGVKFSFNTFVEGMEIEDDRIVCVLTNRGRIFPKLVINAAGLWADYVASLANDQFFTIHPRKGEMAIVDKKKGFLVKSTVSMVSITQAASVTKGGGVIPTVHGNILLGPTAQEVPHKEDYSTSEQGLQSLLKKHAKLVNNLSEKDIITYFAGNRAATYEEDFIVEKSIKIQNLIHVAGIQSPGLTSAPAIAVDVAKMSVEVLSKFMKVVENEKFCPVRKTDPDFSKLSLIEKQKIIEKNPSYGLVICRCEQVTKGQIEQALQSLIPASTLDGIKWRTRAGMGRCQGGFCTPQILWILAEKGFDLTKFTKKGRDSYILLEPTRGDFDGGI
ncbi:NAD(P)/FAD-dependent oxidoreductase [Pseudothermotoga thermarum]|uniref:FAD dependent oxidoreductase n=1 Tax=Pseudothermotoga thermarum DSM 5069 TaxID=688269 RepID=F7YTX6_9THEM|nr:NAD(P)/FAD-dependent oxidoreductase [Pseudothermotoga thermarum]AEH51428.1 FAD dependent oxidoreductase [Pseudothermotoga thermarum DSM 5069]